MTQTRILIVDDEPKLVRLVREVLAASGFAVLSTGSGENAIQMAALEQPDLVLLDIVLSGATDGYEVARRIREFSDVPIMMITAKAREADLLRGFDSGADDYIAKPFSSKELLARAQAVLKRARHEPAARAEGEIACGQLRIDLARRRVTVSGREVHLTPTEYKLLTLLARHAGKVLTQRQILTEVWGAAYANRGDYLRVHMHQLRHKLEGNPARPKWLIHEPGVGYRLRVS